MSSVATDFVFFHSFQVSSVRHVGLERKSCRKSSFPVSIGMSENISTRLSSYTNSKLLYPRFVISLKKHVFGLLGVKWGTSTFYKNGQTQALTDNYRIFIFKKTSSQMSILALLKCCTSAFLSQSHKAKICKQMQSSCLVIMCSKVCNLTKHWN